MDKRKGKKFLLKAEEDDAALAAGGVGSSGAGLKQLEEAIQLLPDEEKAAYFEAKVRCPWLLESDPDPMRFLHYDDFNVWDAAKRYAKYWSMRKELFSDRAFLPMHQTGNGCLSAADLKIFSTGLILCLPPLNQEDGFVACYIPSREVGNETRDALMRVHFYFHHVMMDLNPGDDHSYTVLVALNWIGFQRTLGREREAKMLNHLPLYGKSLFLVQTPDHQVGSRMNFFQLIAPPILKLANMVQLGGRRAQVIAASSHQDLAEQLEAHGFSRENLPPECGGTWSMDQFQQWRRKRFATEMQRERQKYNMVTTSVSTSVAAAAPLDNRKLPPTAKISASSISDASEKSAGKRGASDATEVKSDDNEEDEELPAKGTVERKRALDRLKSKRKRNRRKAKFDALEMSSEEVKAEHRWLMIENSRLERLLARAEQVVHDHLVQQQQQSSQNFHANTAGHMQLQPSSLAQAVGCLPHQQQQQANHFAFNATANIALLPQQHPSLNPGSLLSQLNPSPATNLSLLLQQQQIHQQLPPQAILNNPLLISPETSVPPVVPSVANVASGLQPVLQLATAVGIQQQPAMPQPTNGAGVPVPASTIGAAPNVAQTPFWWNLFASTQTTSAAASPSMSTAGNVPGPSIAAPAPFSDAPLDQTIGGTEQEQR